MTLVKFRWLAIFQILFMSEYLIQSDRVGCDPTILGWVCLLGLFVSASAIGTLCTLSLHCADAIEWTIAGRSPPLMLSGNSS